MARKSTSTASGDAKATECCAKCESDMVDLRKEIAALKALMVKKSAGGADPRVDMIVEWLLCPYTQPESVRKIKKELIKKLT